MLRKIKEWLGENCLKFLKRKPKFTAQANDIVVKSEQIMSINDLIIDIDVPLVIRPTPTTYSKFVPILPDDVIGLILTQVILLELRVKNLPFYVAKITDEDKSSQKKTRRQIKQQILSIKQNGLRQFYYVSKHWYQAILRSEIYKWVAQETLCSNVNAYRIGVLIRSKLEIDDPLLQLNDKKLAAHIITYVLNYKPYLAQELYDFIGQVRKVQFFAEFTDVCKANFVFPAGLLEKIFFISCNLLHLSMFFSMNEGSYARIWIWSLSPLTNQKICSALNSMLPTNEAVKCGDMYREIVKQTPKFLKIKDLIERSYLEMRNNETYFAVAILGLRIGLFALAKYYEHKETYKQRSERFCNKLYDFWQSKGELPLRAETEYSELHLALKKNI